MKRIERLIERELGHLRFFLKSRIAALQEIHVREEKFVSDVRKMTELLRELEFLLRGEVEHFDVLKKKFGRSYVSKRYDALERAIQGEIGHLESEVRRGGELYKAHSRLYTRMKQMVSLIKDFQTMGKLTKMEQLRLLEDFSKKGGEQ